MNVNMDDIQSTYRDIEKMCRRREGDCIEVGRAIEYLGFREMCFCLCTPQSNAHKCWQAIEYMNTHYWYRRTEADKFQFTEQPLREGFPCILYDGGSWPISNVLKSFGVRFHNVKAERIVSAREQWEQFLEGYQQCIEHDEPLDPIFSREWLVDNINGYGMKEASHFLRNIGYGSNLAILDRHILRCLDDLNVIEGIPNHLTIRRYIEIEDAMRHFSDVSCIPMGHLDMVFWYISHGEIFK